MGEAENKILQFLRLLSNYPEDVVIKQANERVLVFEIIVRSEDMTQINKYLGVIQAIVAYETGLLCEQFEVRIFGK
jgi:hypothetical protein